MAGDLLGTGAGTPLVALPLAAGIWRVGFGGPPSAWGAFGYLVLSSQLQLIQPFLTVIESVLLLGESVTWVTWAAGLVVMATVALRRRAPVRRRERNGARPV